MVRTARPFTTSALVAILAGAALLSACASDFGESCDLPEASEVEQSCTPVEGDDLAFCVYNQSEVCESRLCGAYLGSDSFCTEECESDDECPGDAFCQLLTGGSTNGFCVPSSQAETE